MIDESYLKSCKSPFWQRVFQHELEYLKRNLIACKEILSVGCGPAIIEAELVRCGFDLTGLDVSEEAISCAPDSIRTVACRAEEMPFNDSAFDAIIFVVSLQFIDNYAEAIREACRVLRHRGKLIVMLLNTNSGFYRMKSSDPDSYIQKIKHRDNDLIKRRVETGFEITTEYILGIQGDATYETDNPDEAALFVIKGLKR